MQGRKITKKEFEARKTKTKVPTIKVFSGRIKIEEPFFKIEPYAYKWYVLVPAELLSTMDWNRIFRVAHKNRMIDRAVQSLGSEKLEYTNYTLANGSVLFAFK